MTSIGLTPPTSTLELVPVLTCDNRPDAARVCALYRHYDRAGNLLYVGITNNPTRRWLDHSIRSPWAVTRLVAWIEIVWFDSLHTAAVTERALIQRDRPLFNKRRRGGRARDRLDTYLAAGSPEAAAIALGTPRRVRCNSVPGTTCVSCGPDSGVLFA